MSRVKASKSGRSRVAVARGEDRRKTRKEARTDNAKRGEYMKKQHGDKVLKNGRKHAKNGGPSSGEVTLHNRQLRAATNVLSRLMGKDRKQLQKIAKSKLAESGIAARVLKATDIEVPIPHGTKLTDFASGLRL